MAIPDRICCQDCGAVNEAATELVANLERDLRGKRAAISRLKKQQTTAEEADDAAAEAEELYRYWKEKLCPGSREFGKQRRVHVLARLHAGHTLEELKEAVDGCALSKFHRENRRQDLELICRDDAHVQQFRQLVRREPPQPPSEPPDPRLASIYQATRERLTEPLIARLHELRGWTQEAVRKLGLGFWPDEGRVVFPITNAGLEIVGLVRYQPNPARRNGHPKALANGSRELFPAPESIRAKTVWLVEGEPDAVAMASIPYPAVAIPGVSKWREEWAARFDRFERVRILFDCDEEGRAAARRSAETLDGHAEVQVLDLDPTRTDHYDVGDLVREHGTAAAGARLSHLAAPEPQLSFQTAPRPRSEDPFDELVEALESRDCRVIRKHGGTTHRAESQCPAHDDRRPSLTLTEGDDRRVLIHCFAGCPPETVVAALGLEMRDLFA